MPPDAPFSPAALARSLTADASLLRIGLGCEALRIGDQAALRDILRKVLLAGAAKLSARSGHLLVIETRSDLDLSAEACALGGVAERRDGLLRIALPFPEAALSGDDQPRCPDRRLAGRRILVADDSATNRLVISEMLAGAGGHVTLARSGAEAVALAADDGFDLLLLDISMPGMEGVEALAAIRDAGCVAPALAVTANAMSHQVREYLDCGFDGHLAKPLRQEDLVQRAAGLLP